MVAADCEWKEKEITVQEGEAVRFNIVLDIFDIVITVFDITIFDFIIFDTIIIFDTPKAALPS